jgi:hypothetical protein
MTNITLLLIGVAAGVPFLLLARRAGAAREMWLYAIGLALAALVYVAFALAGGAAPAWVALELGSLLFFSLLALLGLRVSAWFLALGWAAHAAWDLLTHGTQGASLFVPAWYPAVCAGFDLLLAGYLILRAARGRARGTGG